MASNRSDVVAVPGSDRAPSPGAQRVGAANPEERIAVTVVLRPRSSTPPATGSRQLSIDELAATRAASPDDISRVEAFARDEGLTVDDVNPAARSMSLSGTTAQLADAFHVELGRFTDASGSYRGRTGPVFVPTDLADVVQAVLGLDDRPQARAHFRIQPQPEGAMQPRAAGTSFSPDQIGKLYDFPARQKGTGQTVAIIELGGGYKAADLTAYFSRLGIRKPSVTAVSVDGAKNAPVGDPNSADGEVLLDIDVVGALAPRAKIAVYFAPNTTRGFYDAVAAAIHDTKRTPSVISISWGQAESGWTAQAMTVYDQLFADAAALGVTITAAAGDDGSTDRVSDGKSHVDFPASSPHVLACGGTRLTVNGNAIADETVWNNGAGHGATGGGVSDQFPLPDYQTGANVPPSGNPGGHVGRGVPDVAADADPQTGYQVRVDGHDLVFGGTSAAAPVWAALVAVANQRLGRRVGFLHPTLYGPAGPHALRDIVAGNNGVYSAASGWDPCTGWGSPGAQALIDSLTAS